MSNTLTPEEVFQQSLDKRRAEKKQEADRKANAGSVQFESINYTALSAGEFKQIRMLGFPANNRMDDPTSVKTVNISMIEGDDGKKFRVVWPDKSQKDWLLWQVLRKVLQYKWNPDEKKREFIHRENHKSVFDMVFSNSNPQNKYEKGWEPSNVTLMNVIDRSIMDQHREAKKTFVLSKRGSEMANGGMWYDSGVPTIFYDEIYDNIAAAYGLWVYYDIVVVKNTKQPYYNVFHAKDSARQLAGLGFEVNMEYAEQPLTDEELSWERYDFDKLFPVTSHTKILNRLGNKISLIDKSFGTKFHETLEELVEEEKKARAEVSDEGNSSSNSNEERQEPEPTQDAPKPKPRARVKLEDSAPDKPEQEDSEYPDFIQDAIDKYGVANMDKLTEDNISMISGYDAEKQTFIYSYPGDPDTEVDIYTCTNESCPMLTPNGFEFCPRCGSKLT